MKQHATISRVIALVLSLILCLGAFVACGGDTPDTPETPDAPDAPDTPPADDPGVPPVEEPDDSEPEENWPDDGETVSIDNIADYTVLRSETAEGDIRLEVSSLYMTMMERFKGIAIGTDYSKDPAPIVNDDYEILIGQTNRAETQKAYEAATAALEGAKTWYHIGVYGNKIVLLGSDDANTLVAIRYFSARYLNGNATTLEVPVNMYRTYEKNQPVLITTPAGDAFVASVDVSKEPYFADRRGACDVSSILQSAIDDVEALGGGVVYLPAGTYRLTKQLVVPSYVTLRGDYVDPDKGNFADGTLLLLDQKGEYKQKSAVLVSRSAAVEGLTFYYEKQSVKSPVNYQPTVETAGNVCTVKDCTFINSYYAIFTGTGAKGMLTVDNVKGTALWRGLDNNNSADICVTVDVHFSPKYWAGAGQEFQAPAEAEIRALMKTNGSIGLSVGDCDRDTYENITLDGFATGIFNRELTRAGLCGSYYNIAITDAKIGIELHGLNAAYGFLLTNSRVEASETAILNVPVKVESTPFVYLMNCEIRGEIGEHVYTVDSEVVDMDVDYKPISNRPVISADKLFNLADYGADATGQQDISAALQTALDEANAAGGGVVYLPAGIYRLTNPVTVGANTVIMGAHQNPQQGSDAFQGTVLLVTYGEGGTETDKAAITVKGDGSGIMGLTVYYPENGVSQANTLTESPGEYSYFARLGGKNCFAVELCLIAASRGICFDGAENFIADRILMTVFDHGIGVYNSKKGAVTRIHTNGTYHNIGARSHVVLHPDWMTDASRVYDLIDTHLSPRMTLVKVVGSRDVQLRHVFHYGAKTFLESADSELFLLNCESGHIGRGKSFLLGGNVDLLGINFIRENPYECLEETKKGNVVTVYQYKAAHRPAGIYLK